ncbi:hypothetical protein CES85_3253 (plasmid) [Ochrobactrum quorumnocens]|uniref:Uncharacterized protein n=1 Tax=Ochrobactrum quorumnocens TaxID=271865 RepID=A0A248UM05_9HYPH|nr:hypothetical protein CES85_5309 [[Ochrobactrum] quorumnocens]ASV87775.1 hypothetical protein CES85_3568 [[Ochrobactrum] quorumnocens]ASV88438.1 hypothetical protein CES85_3253 [[Ochrobactrum] quorumnocens]
MGINGIELKRFSVGRFGDLRLEKRGRGAMRRWWLGQAHVFMSLLKASGAARLALGDFYATPR